MFACARSTSHCPNNISLPFSSCFSNSSWAANFLCARAGGGSSCFCCQLPSGACRAQFPWGFPPPVVPFTLPAPLSAGPLPKLVFNRVNGKRPQVLLPHTTGPEECYTAAHEENVRFVYEAWQEVEQQLDDSQRGESARGPVQYVEKTPDPSLKSGAARPGFL
uniref:MAPK regulated corepressor interacting protein 2 n=1 Tax=Anas platyrhynchos TaxID=8839 RepID=A0A8B9R7D8_ANAPL